MKTNSLKFIALIFGVPAILISCAGPAYVQSAPPPPPVYTQAPPPPPQAQPPVQQETYVDPNYNQPQQENPPPPAITYQTYYTELSPYGQWVYTGEYGNVWVPAAGPDFQPYGSCGHWVLTNYGWTWVSDYSWGWATFHYGRWEFDGLMGWYWIPGYEWSPAWVSWRSTPGYYGWAPLGPTYVNGGYATYNCPPERYVFVNATYINSPTMSTYYEPRNQNATYYTRSTVVTNTYADNYAHTNYYAGPPRQDVEKYTGAPIHPANVVSASSPEKAGANGSQVTVFRPAVHQPSPSDAVQPAPPKVYQKTEIAPIAQRQVLTHPNQPRVEPFKPENVRPASPESNKPQPEQQKPPVQQPQQPKPPVQQPQQPKPPVQQPQPQQQKPPVQQPQQPKPPVQQPQPQQQHPAQQQQPRQQPKQQPKQKPQQPKKQSQPSKQQSNQPEKKQ